MSRQFSGWLLLAACLVPLAACGDDDAKTVDAGPSADADTNSAAVERGRYLVENVFACGPLCHTGTAGPLAGHDCTIVDFDLLSGEDDPAYGCLPSKNLTNDPSGLKNRTDAEIRDMITKGIRPDGSVMFNLMPYWSYANIPTDDVDAMIAFLRTVPGVDRETPPDQPPFDVRFDEALPALDLTQAPQPASDFPERESALRGSYIANTSCTLCHTPPVAGAAFFVGAPAGAFPVDLAKSFIGGQGFPELPNPPFDIEDGETTLVTPNITPHDPTGTGGWEVADIVKVLHEAIDRDGDSICVMPAGPDGAFGGLSDEDARDIANYLLSIPAVDSDVGAETGTCSVVGA
jgi:hypothetical protein